MKKVYHVAFVPKDERTAILQVCEDVDALAPDALEYFGRRITTKKQLRENAATILALVNAQNGTAYTRLVVD